MESRVSRYARLESDKAAPADPSSTNQHTPDVESGHVAAPELSEANASLLEQPPPTWRRHVAVILTAVAISFVSLAVLVPVVLIVRETLRHHRHMRDLTNGVPPLGGVGNVYRTAYHFQPVNNWMNDPNAPVFYNGYYHLFYQWNPHAAVWGNISWGHAVSTDLIHWSYLPVALQPDQWYDINGVWSGSATLLGGLPAIAYTGNSGDGTQTQNLALPADPLDPLLTRWVKAAANPLAAPPAGVNRWDFRDPTTAWRGADGLWRMALGARRTGVAEALVYRSRDFRQWELQEEALHAAPGRTGMWECPDFFPVSLTTDMGLDTSANGIDVRHVLKGSFDDVRTDQYAVGRYNESTGTWSPIDPQADVANGPLYDLGRFYASKTFFDPVGQRRILFGWVNESDTQRADILKGWASVQAIPRTLFVDRTAETFLLQLPVEEVKALRTRKVSVEEVTLGAGDLVEVESATGMQLDLELAFVRPEPTADDAEEAKRLLSAGEILLDTCSQDGATRRGVIGPFGVAVLAASALVEATPIYFEMVPGEGDTWQTRVCSDQSRSSLAPFLDRGVYGGSVRVSANERLLSLRILVDHSIVETFAQGGATAVTSRVYPTRAVGAAAKVFVFNNGSVPVTLRSMAAWEMKGVDMKEV